MVVDRVLQDPLEEHRQLGDRPGRVVFRQLEHRVLHDIERGVLVADREHRLLERAALDVGEQGRNFLLRSQFSNPEEEARRL
jgi:hypothetical protein